MIRWCRSQSFEFDVPASAIFIPQFPTSLPGLRSDLARAQELLRLTGKANEVLKPSNVATKSREVPNQRIQKPCETEWSNEKDVIGVWFYFEYRYWESPGNDSLHHEVIRSHSGEKGGWYRLNMALGSFSLLMLLWVKAKWGMSDQIDQTLTLLIVSAKPIPFCRFVASQAKNASTVPELVDVLTSSLWLQRCTWLEHIMSKESPNRYDIIVQTSVWFAPQERWIIAMKQMYRIQHCMEN